jgi:hypothetical protein
MRSAPVFKGSKDTINKTNPAGYFRRHTVFPCHSLKTVDITGFNAVIASVELALYILDNTHDLRRMSLDPTLQMEEKHLIRKAIIAKYITQRYRRTLPYSYISGNFAKCYTHDFNLSRGSYSEIRNTRVNSRLVGRIPTTLQRCLENGTGAPGADSPPVRGSVSLLLCKAALVHESSTAILMALCCLSPCKFVSVTRGGSWLAWRKSCIYVEEVYTSVNWVAMRVYHIVQVPSSPKVAISLDVFLMSDTFNSLKKRSVASLLE